MPIGWGDITDSSTGRNNSLKADASRVRSGLYSSERFARRQLPIVASPRSSRRSGVGLARQCDLVRLYTRDAGWEKVRAYAEREGAVYKLSTQEDVYACENLLAKPSSR